jgi:hypothetical protein
MANFAPRGSSGFERPAARDNDRKRMLDLRREGHFKYDLREILGRSSLPAEQIASFAATIFSKGSRQSTVEAKDWVTTKLNEQVITKAERDAINTLIDRYSKFR